MAQVRAPGQQSPAKPERQQDPTGQGDLIRLHEWGGDHRQGRDKSGRQRADDDRADTDLGRLLDGFEFAA